MKPIPDALARLYPPRDELVIHTRPWWTVADDVSHLRRADGWVLQRRSSGVNDRVLWTAMGPLVGCAGAAWSHEAPDVAAAMAALDREYPLPCPPPRCGQVWAIPRDDGSGYGGMLVTAEVGPSAVELSGVRIRVPWPVAGAVLLHDPFGHPWAPVE